MKLLSGWEVRDVTSPQCCTTSKIITRTPSALSLGPTDSRRTKAAHALRPIAPVYQNWIEDLTNLIVFSSALRLLLVAHKRFTDTVPSDRLRSGRAFLKKVETDMMSRAHCACCASNMKQIFL